MSAPVSAAGPVRAPLLGHNLVRLLYLDEAGTDAKAPMMCVAGVLVHGDKEWPEIHRRLRGLLEDYLPEEDRPGRVFHATDIFHGSDYFDRRKPEWPQERRFKLLRDIAAIIADLKLPLTVGFLNKTRFATAARQAGLEVPDDKFMHNVAAFDCLVWADYWLQIHAPDELATVVHEDRPGVKERIKYSLRAARGDLPAIEGVPYSPADPSIPLKHIIDTIHWAEKPDALPLQLADLCAFTFYRVMKGPGPWRPADWPSDQVLSDVWDVLAPQITWYGPAEDIDPSEIDSSEGGV